MKPRSATLLRPGASAFLGGSHERLLREESAISDEVIEERGYWTATKSEELRELGFADYQHGYNLP